jgi:transcriptional regulator with XRE-family HTH domain
MAPNWELYKKIDYFTLREAATLWLETPLGSEHTDLEMIERLLNETLVKIWLKTFKTHGKSRQEAYDSLLAVITINRNAVSHNFSMEDLSKIKELPHATYGMIEKMKRSQEDYRFEIISRSKLIEIAKELGEKPKFLFPDVDQDKSKLTTLQDKPLSTKERNSYLKLIKGLLQEQKIDPGERAIAKKLSGMTDRTELSLGEDTIRRILKEIQDLA